MSFHLNWVDAGDDSGLPASRSISNSAWWMILSEVETQGVGDLTQPPPRPRRPLLQRLRSRPERAASSGAQDVWSPPTLDIDPKNCVYPIDLYNLSYHGTVVVTERASQALLQRLSREPTLEYDIVWWPELWDWFYHFLAGAVEHEGFEVG